MLVLSRRPQETIVIGGGISITVVSVQGNQVRLGIEAPRNVPIRRGELKPSASLPAECQPNRAVVADNQTPFCGKRLAHDESVEVASNELATAELTFAI